MAFVRQAHVKMQAMLYQQTYFAPNTQRTWSESEARTVGTLTFSSMRQTTELLDVPIARLPLHSGTRSLTPFAIWCGITFMLHKMTQKGK